MIAILLRTNTCIGERGEGYNIGRTANRQSQNRALGLSIGNHELYLAMECSTSQFLGMECLATSVKQGLSSMVRIFYVQPIKDWTHTHIISMQKEPCAYALVICILSCLVLHALQIHQSSLMFATSYLDLLIWQNFPQAFIAYRLVRL
jgi:hypothetical protein